MDAQKEIALRSLEAAAQARRDADNDYKRAVDECVQVGLTNVEMGKRIGVTEAAIRMMRKRMENTDW